MKCHRKLFWTCRTDEDGVEDLDNGGESLRTWMFEKVCMLSFLSLSSLSPVPSLALYSSSSISRFFSSLRFHFPSLPKHTLIKSQADGSFTRAGFTLFWYGISNIAEVEAAVKSFERRGLVPRGYLPLTPPPGPTSASGKPSASRGYKTWSAGLDSGSRSPQVIAGPGQKRGYATAVQVESNAFPVTTPTKKTLGLIGARGYTGQALVKLLNGHPYLDLGRVSSRALVGRALDGYEKNGGLK